jgi:hypothetical protein
MGVEAKDFASFRVKKMKILQFKLTHFETISAWVGREKSDFNMGIMKSFKQMDEVICCSPRRQQFANFLCSFVGRVESCGNDGSVNFHS